MTDFTVVCTVKSVNMVHILISAIISRDNKHGRLDHTNDKFDPF